MNKIKELDPVDLMPIQEWESCVDDGLFIDYDGFGHFCNEENKTELWGVEVYPSMIGTREYEDLKKEWTHINWFNR